MVEKESSHQNKLDIARETLFTLKDEWAFHVEYNHHGYPGTTCHQCLNHRQKILLAENYYNKLRREKEAQKSPPSLEG